MDIWNEQEFAKQTLEHTPRQLVANCITSGFVLTKLKDEFTSAEFEELFASYFPQLTEHVERPEVFDCFSNIPIKQLPEVGVSLAHMDMPIGNALERIVRHRMGDPDILALKLDGKPVLMTKYELRDRLGIRERSEEQTRRVSEALDRWVAQGAPGVLNVDEILHDDTETSTDEQ